MVDISKWILDYFIGYKYAVKGKEISIILQI